MDRYGFTGQICINRIGNYDNWNNINFILNTSSKANMNENKLHILTHDQLMEIRDTAYNLGCQNKMPLDLPKLPAAIEIPSDEEIDAKYPTTPDLSDLTRSSYNSAHRTGAKWFKKKVFNK